MQTCMRKPARRSMLCEGAMSQHPCLPHMLMFMPVDARGTHAGSCGSGAHTWGYGGLLHCTVHAVLHTRSGPRGARKATKGSARHGILSKACQHMAGTVVPTWVHSSSPHTCSHTSTLPLNYQCVVQPSRDKPARLRAACGKPPRGQPTTASLSNGCHSTAGALQHTHMHGCNTQQAAPHLPSCTLATSTRRAGAPRRGAARLAQRHPGGQQGMGGCHRASQTTAVAWVHAQPHPWSSTPPPAHSTQSLGARARPGAAPRGLRQACFHCRELAHTQQ